MLADLVIAAVNEALRAGAREGRGEDEEHARRPTSGWPAAGACRPAAESELGLHAESTIPHVCPAARWHGGVQPLRREPRRAADPAARDRRADGAAARVPHPAAPDGRGARARRRARGGEGARALLPRVRQPDRGGDLRDLHRRAPRPLDDLRRRAAGRRRLARADARVPRPLPRARRRALAARRRRAGRPAHRRAASAASRRTACRRSCSRRTRT